MRHYTPKVDCVCNYCNVQFQVTPAKIKKGGGKYCSKTCFYAARAKIDCSCLECGTSFKKNPYAIKHGGGKYCSRKCYDLAQSNQVNCVCVQCGKSFTVDPYDIKQGYGKYCSNVCQGLAQRGKNHPLWRGGFSRGRGSNWSVQRKLAWKRDKGECRNCGKKSRTRKNDVHHIRPYRLYNGDYLAANELTNLITLCQTCHKLAEHGSIEIQPYLL